MEKPQEAQNTFAAAAIEQHLLLWQTTRSLLEIDQRLERSFRHEHKAHPYLQKDWKERVKNLFTNFRSS